MAGVGPEIVHETASGSTFWGFAIPADFMMWPSKQIGWYVEPAYKRTFPTGGAHGGFGIAAGLLIGR